MSVDDRLRPMLAELAQMRAERRSLNAGDGGGTSGGVTDDWKASVERELKLLHDDVRRLTGFIIAGAIAPFLAIIGLYVYTGTKFDRVADDFKQVEARIVGVEGKISGVAVQQAETNGNIKVLLERSRPTGEQSSRR